MLEDRLTPAAGVFSWMSGYEGGYNNPLNWDYNETDHSVPTNGDHVYFGFSASPDGVVVPEAFSFASVHLVFAFGGTVTLQDNTVIGYLNMEGGSIAQEGSGHDLYVTQKFDFTGGTLNNTSDTGIVHLQGVDGFIGEGSNFNAVVTGSTLNVESGTTLRYGSGTVEFTNLAFIHCFAGSIVLPDNPGAAVSNFINANPQAPPHLVDGDYTLESNILGQAFFVTTGGHLKITKTLEIAGHTDPADATSASLGMNGGTITVTNGIQLKVEHGFAMNGGTFKTLYVEALGENNTLYLTGNMAVSGGTIQLGSATGFSNLMASGSVSFTGGTFVTKVNGTNSSSERDLWLCTGGKFTYDCGATISPTVLYSPPGGVIGRSWSVIESWIGVEGDAPYIDSIWGYLYDSPTAAKKLSVQKLS